MIRRAGHDRERKPRPQPSGNGARASQVAGRERRRAARPGRRTSTPRPTAARGGAHPRRAAPSSASRRLRRSASRVDVVGLDHESGLPVDHRLVGSAAAPRDRRDRTRGRFEEDDAEPFGLEPAPALATHHREHVAAAVHARSARRPRPARGTGPVVEPEPVRAPFEAARGRGRRPRRRAARRGRVARPRRSTTSKPLRGTSRLTATTVARSGSSPQRDATHAALIVGRRRREPLDVDSRRDHHPGQVALRGRACLRAPGTGPPRRPRRRRAGRVRACGAFPGGGPAP